MNEKRSTSITIPGSLLIELETKIVSEGYGMKGKSQWICEAIEAFLQLPQSDVCELTGIADEMDKLNKRISLKLTDELVEKIDNALIEVRKKHPDLEGVKGKIIRASIIQRLIGRFKIT